MASASASAHTPPLYGGATPPLYLGASSVAWLASAHPVGGGDVDALALLPRMRVPAVPAKVAAAHRAKARVRQHFAHARDLSARVATSWALSEACTALRRHQRAYLQAVHERTARIERPPPEKPLTLGALRATIEELRCSVRSLVLQGHSASAASSSSALGTVDLGTLRAACEEIVLRAAGESPASVDALIAHMRASMPHALVETVVLASALSPARTHYALRLDAVADAGTLANLYLYAHSLLGAHAERRASLYASLSLAHSVATATTTTTALS